MVLLDCERFDEIRQILEQCNDETLQKELDQNLLEPTAYNRQLFGRNFYTKLTMALNQWLNIPKDKLAIIDECVLMLRDSGILVDGIDSVEREADIRRGAASAPSVFGPAITINANGYGYFLALEKLFALEHKEAGRIYTEQIMEILRGQGVDIHWRDNSICPTETEYKTMAIQKTGGLITLVIRLMQLFSDGDKDLTRLAALLALYYHIREDYCGLISEEHTEVKSLYEDIAQGKFNFPLIHAIGHREFGHQIMNILRQRTSDADVKKYCKQLLDKTGSLKYTCETLLALRHRIEAETAKLGTNTQMDDLLNDLRTWEHL